MNDRIKELAKQAGFMPDNFISRWDAEFVLFAELIVQECVGLLGPAHSIMADPIKQHFGVEE